MRDLDGERARATMAEPMTCGLCGRVTAGRVLFYPRAYGGRVCVCLAMCDHHRLTQKAKRRLEAVAMGEIARLCS